MRKLLCLVLAVVMAASMSVMAVSAAQTDAASTGVETAEVTLTSFTGSTVTQTYAVGETFTAYTFLNTSALKDGKVGSLKGTVTYDSSVLEVADSYVTDEEELDYGLAEDIDAILPICGGGGIVNMGIAGAVHYNASTANSFKFLSDTSELIVVQFTVLAAGKTTIESGMYTLAIADDNLTQIVCRGTLDPNYADKFSAPVALSEPAPLPAGSTVSGNITSYLQSKGENPVTVAIMNGDDVVASVSTIENSYVIEGVEDGAYTLRVSKVDHATRDYAITVEGDTVQDVKIHPKGDVNGDGKITNYDYSRVNQHTCGTKKLTDYPFVCADVNGDNKVTNFDAGKINQHASGTRFLW